MIQREHTDIGGMRSGAVFSDCERYRYRLWRIWDDSRPTIAFLLLNPSTADERENDPTIERCQRRAAAMRYGRLEIVNLFPYRATDPQDMLAAEDPIGQADHALGAILDVVEASRIVVCGWGVHGSHRGRADQVVRIIRMAGLGNHLHVLRLTKDGHPEHPLYLSYSLRPQRVEWGDR